MPNNKFEFDFTVLPAHIDRLNHVNNVVYVQWLQDAAEKHWNTYVTPELNNSILWVVKRHEIDYWSPAFLHDELIMKTWTGAYESTRWDRHYELTRKNDGKKIIAAKSVWVLLDKATLRPKKIEAEVLAVLGGE
jgi:acyl-CoA thioester hydrolase